MTTRGASSEAARYRRAAENALKLLDWCIWYFGHENERNLADRLERNRGHIGRLLAPPGDDAAVEAEDSSLHTLGVFVSSLMGKVSRMADNNGDGRSGETERYRQAATEALEMLDWCIGYLVGIRKDSIATQLAKNRKHIREDLMNEPAEPVPTDDD